MSTLGSMMSSRTRRRAVSTILFCSSLSAKSTMMLALGLPLEEGVIELDVSPSAQVFDPVLEDAVLFAHQRLFAQRFLFALEFREVGRFTVFEDNDVVGVAYLL